jgi:protein MpaA
VHGNEPEGSSFARALADSLRQLDANSIPHDVFILPLLNPDGLSANTRQNANGVDLNRNFPTRDFAVGDSLSVYFGGKEALSEPETKLLLDLIGLIRPTVLVSLHVPLNCVNYDGDARGLAVSLAEAMGLPLKENIGYATPGSLGTYYGKEHSLPVITVEFTAGEASWSAYVRAFLETLLSDQPDSR